MKLRHAAALTLVGWYLMVPPINRATSWSRFWFGEFADWVIADSFDSAKECEEYRDQMIAAQGKIPLRPPGSKIEPQSPLDYPPADALALPNGEIYSPSLKRILRSDPTAICIASDDPRLAK